jgi:hypothetical protein
MLKERLAEGHGFSHAAKYRKINGALAPEVRFSFGQPLFSMRLFADLAVQLARLFLFARPGCPNHRAASCAMIGFRSAPSNVEGPE